MYSTNLRLPNGGVAAEWDKIERNKWWREKCVSHLSTHQKYTYVRYGVGGKAAFSFSIHHSDYH